MRPVSAFSTGCASLWLLPVILAMSTAAASDCGHEAEFRKQCFTKENVLTWCVRLARTQPNFAPSLALLCLLCLVRARACPPPACSAQTKPSLSALNSTDDYFVTRVRGGTTASDVPLGTVCDPVGLFGWSTSAPRAADAAAGCNGAAVSAASPPCYAGIPCLQHRGSSSWKECEKWNWRDSFCPPGYWAEDQSLDNYANGLDAATRTVQVPTVRSSNGRTPIASWVELDAARREWDCGGVEARKLFGCIEAPYRTPCRRCGASRRPDAESGELDQLLAPGSYHFLQKTYQFAHLRKTVRAPYNAERCSACPPGQRAVPSNGQAVGEDGAYFGCEAVVCDAATHRLDLHTLTCVALPIDGAWASWGAWSACSAECGPGEQTRSRTCTDPPPQYGGADCSGSEVDEQHCHDAQCCAAGTYRGPQRSCQPCGPGRFQDKTRQAVCKACPPGQHQDQTGQRGCKACVVGRAAANPAESHCAACAAGKYQSNVAASLCAACPPGQYIAVAGGSSCATCTAGQYQSQSGATSCSACVYDCPHGHEHNEECGPSAPGRCVSCGWGRAKLISDGLRTTSGKCSACTTGHFAGATGSHTCTACAAGQFQDEDEASACKPCEYTCAAGLFHAACGGSNAGSCVACAAGQYAPDGPTKSCWLCRAGSYTSSAGYGQCDTCNGSTEYQDERGATACKPTQLCAAFEYETVAPTPTSNRACAAAMKECPHGQWESRSPGPKNDRECTVWRACAANEYQHAEGGLHADRDCRPHSAECPNGHWETRAPGTHQDRACAAHAAVCDFSTHWESVAPGPMRDRKCEPLTICGPGSREVTSPTETSDRWCALCQAGAYKPTAGNERACFQCPDGYRSRADRKACTAYRCSHVECEFQQHKCSRFGSSHFQRSGSVAGDMSGGNGARAGHHLVDGALKSMFDAEECSGRSWKSIRVFHHGREHQCASSRGGHLCAAGAVSGDRTVCECKPRLPVPDFASLQGDTTQSGCDWSVAVGRSDKAGEVVHEVTAVGDLGDTFAFEGCSSLHYMARACINIHGPNAGVAILRRRSKAGKLGPIVGVGSCCTHKVACGHARHRLGECGRGICRGGRCICAEGWATHNADHPCNSQSAALVAIEHARSVVLSSKAKCHNATTAERRWLPPMPWSSDED